MFKMSVYKYTRQLLRFFYNLLYCDTTNNKYNWFIIINIIYNNSSSYNNDDHFNCFMFFNDFLKNNCLYSKIS